MTKNSYMLMKDTNEAKINYLFKKKTKKNKKKRKEKA